LSQALAVAREALRDEPAWVVGGAVRDRLLGRPVLDLDVAVAGDPRTLARHLAMVAGGPVFQLSGEFGAWRVYAPDRGWQVDVTVLQGDTIEEDLAQRDFTVNAIGEPLEGGPLIDPHDGAADLEQRCLRMVSEEAFDRDPLRVLRLARFAAGLGFEPDAATVAAAAKRAPRIDDVAPERVFGELKHVLTSDRPLEGLALMDELGLTEHVLPELVALRGIEQNRFHHLDVHDHTLAVLAATIALERDPAAVLGEEHGAAIAAFLAEPLADDLTRGDALRFGALLHDAGKPATRDFTQEGNVTFIGHDREGARISRELLARLRASERLRAHVAALAEHHLRLGFLVHRRPLDRRAIYRYLKACEPVEVDVTLLSVADRLATRGDNSEPAIAVHLELAREILGPALAWHAEGRRPPLVRGDELASALGIEEGPRLGELLSTIAEAAYVGEVSTRDAAVALARRVLEEEQA
jgi:putative nucleotidyltransferase with HDIG domain